MDIKSLLSIFIMAVLVLVFAPSLISGTYTGDCYYTYNTYTATTLANDAWGGYNVTGAGTTAVNGIYCNYNFTKINGCLSYNKTTYKLTYDSTLKSWNLNSTTVPLYYNRSSATCAITLTGWQNETANGADPPPTLVATTCSGFLYYDYNVTLTNVTSCPFAKASLATKVVIGLIPLFVGILLLGILFAYIKFKEYK